jgi:hypothetical protein
MMVRLTGPGSPTKARGGIDAIPGSMNSKHADGDLASCTRKLLFPSWDSVKAAMMTNHATILS